MQNRIIDDKIVVANSVTKIGPECVNRVIIGGSHGGIYATYLAVREKVRGVILNDAGFAKNNSGVAGGDYCQELGIPYAAIDTLSCCIGNAESHVNDGIVSFINLEAKNLGVTIGMTALEAAYKLCKAGIIKRSTPEYSEARTELAVDGGKRRVVLMDSASLVKERDKGSIVVTGSHGGIPAPDPESALRCKAFAAFFHDAGRGKADAGLTRLQPLNDRGIIAGTVSGMSACIGDGSSVYNDGILSNLNNIASKAGGEIGMSLKTFIDALVLK